MVSHHGFNLLFLKAEEDGYFFKCLFAICISFLVKNLFKSCSVLNRVIV